LITTIRRDSDFPRILDHQAGLQRKIKVGTSLCENGRPTNMWFMIPVALAQTIEEYNAHIMTYLVDRLRGVSLDLGWPLLRSVRQVFHIRVAV
jgi:hypothetical protein